MKVLLVVPRYANTRSPDYGYLFPLGLAYISSAMKAAGHQVTCINLNHYQGPTAGLVKRALDESAFDVLCSGHLGFGVEALQQIVEAARRHPSHPRVVLGGIIVTSAPETMIRYLRPDVAVLGEGEETVVELLATLEKGGAISGVRGLGYLDDRGRLVLTPPRDPPADLDALPWPDFEGLGFRALLDNSFCNVHPFYIFTDHPRFYPLIGSRGCPFGCTFCYHPERYRARSIPDIMRELRENVPRYDVNAIFLYDDLLNASRPRLEEFCREMIRLREELERNLRWLCQLSVMNVDREMIRMLKEAGCYAVGYGFESMSRRVLKSMHKHISPEAIQRAFTLTVAAGLILHANFIFGDPAETIETAETTLDFWERTCQGQVFLGFVQPFPGSEIYRRCLERGIISDALTFIRRGMGFKYSANYINMTDTMTKAQFQALRRRLIRSQMRYYRFVRPTSLRRTQGNLYEVALRCPFCEREILYRNFLIPHRLNYSIWMNCTFCNRRFNLLSLFRLMMNRFLPPRLRFALESLYNWGVIRRKNKV